MVLFLCPQKVTKHYKNRGFSRHMGKTQNGTFGCKSANLGRGLERGFYYRWYLKAVFCWKHYFYSVFSKTQLADMKECYLTINKNLSKIGGCLPKCKKVFFWSVFFVFGGFVLFLCVFVVMFCKKAQKGYFLKSFLSSYSVFFFVFLLSSLSRFHFFFAFCPSTPFGKHYYFGFSCFLFLAFSFSQCLLVSLKQTFLTSPFWNPSCFHFWLFFFSSVVFVSVFMVCVSAFRFLCWFCFWYFSCFACFLCLCVVACFVFSLWKTQFPCNSGVFELCWLKGSLFLMFYAFVLVFLFLVLFVCSLKMKLHCYVSVLSAFFFL